MDKYDLVLDIIEHPDRYSSEQLRQIFSDTETREIYNLLCKTDSAIKSQAEPDVNEEWENFTNKHAAVRPRHSFLWFGSRAASIAAIIGTSILAVAAGVAVTVSVIGHKSQQVVENESAIPSDLTVTTDTVAVRNDTVSISPEPVMFENEPLGNIMKEVAEAYGVEVNFNNEEVASLHLYYKFDPSLSLDEVVEQLNTFEQINIEQNGNILNID